MDEEMTDIESDYKEDKNKKGYNNIKILGIHL